MRLLWQAYKGFCLFTVSAGLFFALVIAAAGYGSQAWQSPVTISLSPDGLRQLRVFTAGQGSIPPNYRAGVRFELYDPARLPFFRSGKIAEAAFADGWSIAWQSANEVTISTGPLSWFDEAPKSLWGVTVKLHMPAIPAQERDCIGQAFHNTTDGVTCFDALLRPPTPPR